MKSSNIQVFKKKFLSSLLIFKVQIKQLYFNLHKHTKFKIKQTNTCNSFLYNFFLKKIYNNGYLGRL